jgi:hypothetical protein
MNNLHHFPSATIHTRDQSRIHGGLENEPHMILLVLTPDPNRIVVRFRDDLKEFTPDGSVVSVYTGRCLGRYDILIELEGPSLSLLHACTGHLRKLASEHGSSVDQENPEKRVFSGWISAIPCFRFRTSRACVDASEEKPVIRSYSTFRMSPSLLPRLLKLAEKSIFPMEVFWGPTAYNFVIQMTAPTVEELAKHILSTREHFDWLQDFCSFVTLNWEIEEDSPSKIPFEAYINVKLCEKEALERLLSEYPDSVYRTGYYDMILNRKVLTLASIFKEVGSIRSLFRGLSTPNRTATLTGFNVKDLKETAS